MGSFTTGALNALERQDRQAMALRRTREKWQRAMQAVEWVPEQHRQLAAASLTMLRFARPDENITRQMVLEQMHARYPWTAE